MPRPYMLPTWAVFTDRAVTTLCSQNTTRGGRLESYVITTDPQAARAVEDALEQLAAFTIDNNANPTNP